MSRTLGPCSSYQRANPSRLIRRSSKLLTSSSITADATSSLSSSSDISWSVETILRLNCPYERTPLRQRSARSAVLDSSQEVATKTDAAAASTTWANWRSTLVLRTDRRHKLLPYLNLIPCSWPPWHSPEQSSGDVTVFDADRRNRRDSMSQALLLQGFTSMDSIHL